MTRSRFATRRRDREASDRNVRPAGAGKPRLNLTIEATLRAREHLCFSLGGPAGGAVDRARLPPARTYFRIKIAPPRAARWTSSISAVAEGSNEEKKSK